MVVHGSELRGIKGFPSHFARKYMVLSDGKVGCGIYPGITLPVRNFEFENEIIIFRLSSSPVERNTNSKLMPGPGNRSKL